MVVAFRVAFHESIGAEEQRALGAKLHKLAATKTQQQQGPSPPGAAPCPWLTRSPAVEVGYGCSI